MKAERKSLKTRASVRVDQIKVLPLMKQTKMALTHLDMSLPARVHFCLMEGEKFVLVAGDFSSNRTGSSSSGSGCESWIFINDR